MGSRLSTVSVVLWVTGGVGSGRNWVCCYFLFNLSSYAALTSVFVTITLYAKSVPQLYVMKEEVSAMITMKNV